MRSEQPSYSQELETAKEALTGHFVEEIKVKKRIHELEQKMETAALSLMTKKNEMSALSRDKGRDNIQVKVLSEEVEDTQQ